MNDAYYHMRFDTHADMVYDSALMHSSNKLPQMKFDYV